MLNAFEAVYYIVGWELASPQATIRAETKDTVSASRHAIARSRELIARSDRTLVRHRAVFWWLSEDDLPRR